MSTKAKKKDCKDFPSFSCQGIRGYTVSLSMTSFLLKTSSQLCLYSITCTAVSFKQAQPIRVHIITMLYYLMVRMH